MKMTAPYKGGLFMFIRVYIRGYLRAGTREAYTEFQCCPMTADPRSLIFESWSLQGACLAEVGTWYILCFLIP